MATVATYPSVMKKGLEVKGREWGLVASSSPAQIARERPVPMARGRKRK